MWSLAADIDVSSVPPLAHFTLEIRDNPASETIVVEDSTAEEQNITPAISISATSRSGFRLFEALWQEVALRATTTMERKYMDLYRPRRADDPCLQDRRNRCSSDTSEQKRSIVSWCAA